MSRIGNKPLKIPAGVTVDVGPGRVTVNGPKGELTQVIDPAMTVKLEDDVLTVSRPTDRGPHRALHGLTRSLIANMVEGVTSGFEKKLLITGVKRVSRPGRRVYARKDRLPRVLGGLGTAILSTSTGLVTSRQAAERGIGGEVIAFVW